MENDTDNIIFMRAIRHAENNLVLQCYSEKTGRSAFYLRNAGKSVRHLLFPMNLLEVTFSKRRQSSMPLIRGISAAANLWPLRNEIPKYTMAQYMAEILYKTTGENVPDGEIFRLGTEFPAMLAGIETGYSNLHLLFTVRLACLLGYMPVGNMDQESRPRFNIAGAEYCNMPPGNEVMDDRSSMILHCATNMDTGSFLAIPASGSERRTFLNYMIRYLAYGMACKLEIKSLEILGEIFR